MTNIDLYEALRPSIGEDAAKMIAEVVPPSRDLVTRADFAELRAEFAELRADVRTEMAALETRLVRMFVVTQVPVMLGILGMIVAIFVRT